MLHSEKAEAEYSEDNGSSIKSETFEVTLRVKGPN